MILKILTTIGGIITIGFGAWHFFVPKIWNWYSYIDENAAELILAVRAINIFFSLSLVLLGIANIIFIQGKFANRYSVIIMLSISSVLWITRTVLQLIYPQGSMNPILQYGMLTVFSAVTILYLTSLSLIILTNTGNPLPGR